MKSEIALIKGEAKFERR